jgi:hypothetical protein
MTVSFASVWLCCGGHGGDSDGDGDDVGVGFVALFSITFEIVARSVTFEFVARAITFEIMARSVTFEIMALFATGIVWDFCDSFCLLFACFVTCTDLSLARQAYGLDVSHKSGALVGPICGELSCILSFRSGWIV